MSTRSVGCLSLLDVVPILRLPLGILFVLVMLMLPDLALFDIVPIFYLPLGVLIVLAELVMLDIVDS